MAVSVLTLTCKAQLYAVVLSNPVAVCSSGAMRGEKMWRWEMYAASSSSFVIKKPWGFLSVRMLAHMSVLNGIRHTCHSPDVM